MLCFTIHAVLTTKKESERSPRSPATDRGRLEDSVGEEAPEARTSAPLSLDFGPATGEAGEEAGAALKTLQ